MREKLIELIKAAHNAIPREYIDDESKTVRDCFAAEADHLLANGVIVLPCKAGDTVWRVVDLKYGGICAWEIVQIQIFHDEVVFIDDSDNDFTEEDIGKTVFLTKEEAEAALKKGDK